MKIKREQHVPKNAGTNPGKLRQMPLPEGSPGVLQSQAAGSSEQTTYRILANNVAVGIFRNSMGPNAHLLEVNPALVRMLGATSKSQLLCHSIDDFCTDDQAKAACIAELTTHGIVQNKVMELTTLANRKFTAYVTVYIKTGPDGLVYFDGIVEDIAERGRAIGRLRRVQDKLETEVQGHIKQITSLNAKLSADMAERQRIETLTLAYNQSLEAAKHTMITMWEDLNAEKERLVAANAKNEAILRSIGEGLLGIDARGKVMVMNPAAEKILGWRCSELLGKSISKLKILDSLGHPVRRSDRPAIRVLQDGVPAKSSFAGYAFVRKDEQVVPVSVTATPIRLGHTTIGAIEVFRDVSLEQQIDRAKTEFVSLASHQLRTPLGIVKWYLEALGADEYLADAPPKVRVYLDQIMFSNERVIRLVRDLLSVARIDQHKAAHSEKTDIGRLVLETVTELQVVALQQQVQLELEIAKSPALRMKADPTRLHEVVENLVANALYYTLPGGVVSVAVHAQETEILISVRDTGIGISPRDIKQLFTKFFRTAQAARTHTGGTGLGLYVVKSYVEGWGGRVLVESTEGIGSTFSITIPRSAYKKQG